MARDLFRIEKGLGIEAENGNGLVEFLSGTAAPDGLGDQASAPIGSLYIRSGTGELYQKIANAGNSADWELNGSSSGIISRWRNENVCLTTGDDLAAGSFDVSTLTDLETTLVVGDTPVGGYIADGAGDLWEITANGSFPTITIAAAGTAPVEGDAFITKKYLPDSPANQENQAGILFTSGAFVKIFDIDWDFATGINLSSGYSAVNGTITNADSVESALEKLDGNQLDLTTLSGVSQGSTDLGTFTGVTIPDAQNNKQALQALETAHEEVDQNVDDLITLSGRPENSTDQGAMPGDILSDGATNNALFQEVDNELTRQRGKSSSTGITGGFVTVDSVLVDDVAACTWQVHVQENGTPANKQAFDIFSVHNGSADGVADATAVDDNKSKTLKLGANFNVQVQVVLSGAGAGQVMQLQFNSSDTIDVYAKRIETLF